MKALVLFSGGVDSTTCLGLAVKKYGADNVTALSVSYGQKHIKEIEAAAAITKYYGTERIELDLSLIFQYSDCSLLKNSEQNIPHESYSEQLKRKTALLFQLMFPSETDCFWLLRQVLRYPKNAV